MQVESQSGFLTFVSPQPGILSPNGIDPQWGDVYVSRLSHTWLTAVLDSYRHGVVYIYMAWGDNAAQ